MTSPRFQRPLFPGAVLHGKQIWISELLSVVLLAVVMSALFALAIAIRANSVRSANNLRLMAELEREDLELRYEIERYRAQYRLLSALRGFIGKRIPEDRLYLLTYLVFHNSQQFGYDPLLVLAVIRVESYFDPRARGVYKSGRESGALGLMQLKYATAELVAAELGIELNGEADLFKPEINIPLGIAYLTKQIRFFESFKLGILAYNQGPGTILNDLKARRPLSVKYYRLVLEAYYKLKRIADETEAAQG